MRTGRRAGNPEHKNPSTPSVASLKCLAHPSPDKNVHTAGKAHAQTQLHGSDSSLRPRTGHTSRGTKLPARSIPIQEPPPRRPPTPLRPPESRPPWDRSRRPASMHKNPDSPVPQSPHLTHPRLARQFCTSTTGLTHKLHELSGSTTPSRSAASRLVTSGCTKLPARELDGHS